MLCVCGSDKGDNFDKLIDKFCRADFFLCRNEGEFTRTVIGWEKMRNLRMYFKIFHGFQNNLCLKVGYGLLFA